MSGTGSGLFCHVVERLQQTAQDVGSALAGRLEHGAAHSRASLGAGTAADRSGVEVVAGSGNSAERAGVRVPIYARTQDNEWRTLDLDRVVREPAYNSADEVVGVIYPNDVHYYNSRVNWIHRNPGEELHTPQAYLRRSATAENDPEHALYGDRPSDRVPFGDDPNTISMHGNGDVYAVNVDASFAQPYGERTVFLGEKSAARLVASDPIYQYVADQRKDREVVVDSCLAGADENKAKGFADELFKAGVADGPIHFPTDLITGGLEYLEPGQPRKPVLSVIANYDEAGDPQPLWRSITKEGLSDTRATE
ncbi:MAG: hypothetical protein HOQ44_05320 [Nocardia sp.]|nr:hypothetical protein [Nocardia sp.]